MKSLEASPSITLGGMYWGPMPLPRGAVLMGCIFTGDRDFGEGGALLRLGSGAYVQGNAGAIRSLNQKAAEKAVRRATR